MYIHDSQSRIVAVRSFHGVDFNHNIQRFFSTSRFIDNKKNVGSRGHKNEQGYSRRDSACKKRRLRLTKKSLQLNNQMQ